MTFTGTLVSLHWSGALTRLSDLPDCLAAMMAQAARHGVCVTALKAASVEAGRHAFRRAQWETPARVLLFMDGAPAPQLQGGPHRETRLVRKGSHLPAALRDLGRCFAAAGAVIETLEASLLDQGAVEIRAGGRTRIDADQHAA